MLRGWSSTKPFSRIGSSHLTGSESGPTLSILLAWWIMYWSVLEYAMNRVGPHNFPGRLRSWGVCFMIYDLNIHIELSGAEVYIKTGEGIAGNAKLVVEY